MLRIVSHPDCELHATPQGHPERPERLAAAMRGLEGLEGLSFRRATAITDDELRRVHQPAYVASINGLGKARELISLDPDTWWSSRSEAAVRLAAGAARDAVDQVMSGGCERAFAVVRPPGHHAEAGRAMGFCVFNSIAVATAHALVAHGLSRVAVCDFDVHHGNGTEAIFAGDERVLFLSSHQFPLYPGTGDPEQAVAGNVVNDVLRAGDGGTAFRKLWSSRFLPRLEAFSPQLVLVSAGFDAHRADPLAQIELEEADFAWIATELRAIANRHADRRLVASLEGGYDLGALERSVRMFARALA
jgi:acetoin utilization deacetylase AcuC-like enzyme